VDRYFFINTRGIENNGKIVILTERIWDTSIIDPARTRAREIHMETRKYKAGAGDLERDRARGKILPAARMASRW
jgi:hypothetical protein